MCISFFVYNNDVSKININQPNESSATAKPSSLCPPWSTYNKTELNNGNLPEKKITDYLLVFVHGSGHVNYFLDFFLNDYLVLIKLTNADDFNSAHHWRRYNYAFTLKMSACVSIWCCSSNNYTYTVNSVEVRRRICNRRWMASYGSRNENGTKDRKSRQLQILTSNKRRQKRKTHTSDWRWLFKVKDFFFANTLSLFWLK